MRQPRCNSLLGPVTVDQLRGAYMLARRYRTMARKERSKERREMYESLARDFLFDAKRYRDELNERA